ncbi:MAG: isoleucine--tRNA ligase, partial [Methanoregulaceae archaeon]|nr:isoleucine--tRNA ligase [Methanoregulaceae archaeon]
MKEVTSSYDAHTIEESVQEYWRSEDIYGKVKELHAGDPPFFFVDGPPYTTGHIHLGTAWNKILKDSILRYRRMTGRDVIARAGYDMHGLPIEVRVEQQLGFSSKKEIETYGIGKFIDQCRDFAAKNLEVMSEQFMSLGVWLDFKDPYRTMHPEYIEAAWWTCRKAAEHNMLEKGFRVVNWCPRCATAIADAEVEYWDETDPSIYVKFPVHRDKNEYLVIWTTTPWTLPANVAVAVHPDFVYAKVRAVKGGTEEILWIMEDLVEQVLRKGRYQDYKILEKKTGVELIGTKYRSPLHEQVPAQRKVEHRVVAADFVARENTGLVHIAPGHGWDDYLLGQRENLEILCPVDTAGRFTAEGGILECMFVRDANRVVLDELGDHLLSEDKVVHRYGHCWRCKTPIIFRATEQWFLKASELRDRMLEEVAEVTWYPEWAGSARFHDWIKEARDWCISRQRYWGIPIPIWECKKCDTIRVIGTIAELEKASGISIPDPHRPYVDEVTIPCTCGGVMKRVEDIFDVWFDSAVASWATLRFPGDPVAFERLWPADFIAEGQDQTRGWFYSQLGASTIAFNRSPYRSVLMHGFALDAEGRKMSKSLGNVVTPEEVIASQGVDVLRLYVLSSSAPWDDLKFNWEGIKTVARGINIFWNVYRFPIPYMVLDGFIPAAGAGRWDGEFIRKNNTKMQPLDRWIVSRVQSLTTDVEQSMETCQLHRATRAILQFVLDDLSRWYVQLVRPRMWLEGESEEKRHAYETIYYVMRRLVQILAPFAPHIAEEIYRNIRTDRDQESVHMLGWPVADKSLTDLALEAEMGVAMQFDEAQANARQLGKRKLRWPVKEVVVASGDPTVTASIRNLGEIYRERANARSVVASETYDRVAWRAEPQMKVLGPKFGKDAPKVRAAILEADGSSLKKGISDGIFLDGNRIDPSYVKFEEVLPQNVTSVATDLFRVYVDSTLTPELEAEGYAREVVRRFQEMRKKADLKVEDHIVAAAAIPD